jgi:flavin reductase (DIM6/NTAB) family NADH-FMN oxidoreductase RutF
VPEDLPHAGGHLTPDSTAFRQVMSRLATGVTVVTTVADSLDHAMTANAVTSVSLAPLLVLVSVDRTTRFHEALAGVEHFGISVLPASAVATARWLATSGRPLAGQLDDVPHHRGASGVALLDGALATVECRVWARYDGGDHELVLGEVTAMDRPDADADPLLYFRSGYRVLRDQDDGS